MRGSRDIQWSSVNPLHVVEIRFRCFDGDEPRPNLHAIIDTNIFRGWKTFRLDKNGKRLALPRVDLELKRTRIYNIGHLNIEPGRYVYPSLMENDVRHARLRVFELNEHMGFSNVEPPQLVAFPTKYDTCFLGWIGDDHQGIPKTIDLEGDGEFLIVGL
jgi:hypothetical protein